MASAAGLIGQTPCGSSRSIQARDQQQVHDFNGPVRCSDGDRSAGGGGAEQFGMVDRDRTSIGQMEVEWLKRPFPVHFSELFDGHGRS
jgi:hypothetical protein